MIHFRVSEPPLQASFALHALRGLKMASRCHNVKLPQDAQVAPSWPQVGPSWAQLGLNLSPSWAKPRLQQGPLACSGGCWEAPGSPWAKRLFWKLQRCQNDLHKAPNPTRMTPKHSQKRTTSGHHKHPEWLYHPSLAGQSKKDRPRPVITMPTPGRDLTV